MDHRIGLGGDDGLDYGLAVKKVECDGVGAERFQARRLLGRAGCADHLVSGVDQLGDEPGADGAARSYNKDLHHLLLSTSVSHERAGIQAFRNAGAVRRPLGLPDELVGEEDEAVTNGLGIDQAHGLLVAGLTEEALARPEHDWEDDQPQLVDQVMLD